MIKYLKTNYKNPEFWFFTVLSFVVILPVLAPIFSALGMDFIAKPIYFLYSFTCHQFHTRSFHVFDSQYAWCARDTGIWFGIWSGAVLYKLGFIKPIHLLFLPIFIIPIALDGGIQTISTFINLTPEGNLTANDAYFSNNLTRFMTGTFFGLGLGLFLVPKFIKSRESKIPFNNFYKLILSVLAFFIIHFSIVQIWSVTSSDYEPTNLVDSVPKVQEVNFFERRRNGECPTVSQDELLALDCFF